MPTSTNVTNLKINELTEAQYDAAVLAGTIGANEISILTDAGNDAFVPQLETMPVASADNVGQIVQYSGLNSASYRKGYFYESRADITPESTSISQTVGSGLTDLSVNLSTFVAEEQPASSETVNFVCQSAGGNASVSPSTYDNEVYFSITNPDLFVSTCRQDLIDDGYSGDFDRVVVEITCRNGELYSTGCYFYFYLNGEEQGGGTGTTDTLALTNDFGITFDGRGATEQWLEVLDATVSGGGSATWTKNNQTVDPADYGISYSGNPTVGDTLTVVYTASTIIGYYWAQKDVQPNAVTSVNGQTGAVTVQETLVSGTNIKTIDGNSVLGSGNLELSTYLTYPAGWTTTGTTKAFCDAIAADSSAVAGKAYLGAVTFSDLPASMANAEIVVEVIAGSTAANKIIVLSCTSGNTAPYKWQYTYWNNGTNVSGWNGFTTINDNSTSSLTETWSANKLNTMIGDVETLLAQI